MNNILVNIAIPINCKLGEGIHWDSEKNGFWFVDILNHVVYFYNLENSDLKKMHFDQPVGWVIPIANSNKIMIGLKYGIAFVSFFEINEPIIWFTKDFPGQNDLRLNDAKVDKYGKLWLGSISSIDESNPVGSLARVNFVDKKIDIIDTNYKVTNGPAFNDENTIMLHNDSGKKITYIFKLDKNNGDIINKSIWRTYSEQEGCPDGMNFDTDGNVWIAHWGVGQVCKYNIEGKLLQTISIPTPNVTNICFGGKELNRIFVTTASNNLNTDNIVSEFDGAIFEIIGTNAKGLNSNFPKL
jgi:sugar lactone lactonase YvrE